MILKESLGNTIYFGSYELCKQVFIVHIICVEVTSSSYRKVELS